MPYSQLLEKVPLHALPPQLKVHFKIKDMAAGTTDVPKSVVVKDENKAMRYILDSGINFIQLYESLVAFETFYNSQHPLLKIDWINCFCRTYKPDFYSNMRQKQLSQ